MGVVHEFQEFAVKGNFIDLAVAVVLGAASGKVVTSIVENVIMPPIGAANARCRFARCRFARAQARVQSCTCVS